MSYTGRFSIAMLEHNKFSGVIVRNGGFKSICCFHLLEGIFLGRGDEGYTALKRVSLSCLNLKTQGTVPPNLLVYHFVSIRHAINPACFQDKPNIIVVSSIPNSHDGVRVRKPFGDAVHPIVSSVLQSPCSSHSNYPMTISSKYTAVNVTCTYPHQIIPQVHF